MVPIPNSAGSRLFQSNMTTLPKTNMPAAIAIGMKMALLIQKPAVLSFPQHFIISLF
jgi:hypothetical protein